MIQASGSSSQKKQRGCCQRPSYTETQPLITAWFRARPESLHDRAHRGAQGKGNRLKVSTRQILSAPEAERREGCLTHRGLRVW